eukprot:COSAG04_NODE_2258_length_4432_cov_1.870759_7_plen_66_part_00
MRSEMTVGVELSAATLCQASRQSRRRGGGVGSPHDGDARIVTLPLGTRVAQVLGEEDRTSRRAVV